MFNQAVAGQRLARHVSTNHDPLFRFHRWLANLRVREIKEIKSIPYTPVSHPFVERLIGSIRREYLDRVFFWNSIDLMRKLAAFQIHYNVHRVHRALAGTTPAQRTGAPPLLLRLLAMPGSSIVGGCFTPQPPLEQQFATNTVLKKQLKRSAIKLRRCLPMCRRGLFPSATGIGSTRRARARKN